MKFLLTLSLTLLFVTGKCQDGSLKFQSYQKMTAYLDRDGNFKLSGGWEASRNSIVFNTMGGHFKNYKTNLC